MNRKLLALIVTRMDIIKGLSCGYCETIDGWNANTLWFRSGNKSNMSKYYKHLFDQF